jgi:hypothetical protein
MILKDAKIEYIEQKESSHLPSSLSLLHNTELKEGINEVKALEMNTLYRIFCRGELTLGGRYYAKSIIGKTWQGLSKEERKTITINGNETAEYDYPAHHSNILLDIHNLRYGTFFEDDYTDGVKIWFYPSYREETKLKLYDVKIDGDIVPKQLVKPILNMGYNTKDWDQLFKVIQGMVNSKEIEFSKEEEKWKSNINKTIKAVFEHNYKLKEFACDDKGVWLQNIDSDITSIVLEYFTNRNILCLPIHDSYIVEKKYYDTLKEVCKQAYNHVVKGWDLKIIL